MKMDTRKISRNSGGSSGMKFQRNHSGKVEVDFGRLGTDFCGVRSVDVPEIRYFTEELL